MKSKRVLCVYATRQIDSNLFMSSTVFRGLKEAGYETYMIFAGTEDVISNFKRDYAHYFNSVEYITIKQSFLKKMADNYPLTRLGYSYYRHFLADGFKHLPLKVLKNILNSLKFHYILSFIPPVISGRLAIDIKKQLNYNIPLIQFWTDPLSLGRCNSIEELPKSRLIHKWHEERLIKSADKVVFCYPLLCEMEKKIHTHFAHKMTWSDISYTEHKKFTIFHSNKPLIGFFGAYQTRVRNINPLLEAIQELQDFNFIIRGDGDLPKDFKGIRNLDLEVGRKPLNEIEKLENQCDILISLSGRSGLTHPAGKTFYYASYPKPIIHIGDGINAEYFANYISGFDNRFIHCMNNKEDIKEAIKLAIGQLANFELKIPDRMNAAVIARKILEL